MDYYIQGDAANADKIKAAFERLGYDASNWKFNVNGVIYYTKDEKKIDVACSKFLINLIKTHQDYQEVKLPVEPKFKVGSWLYHNSNGVRPVLVTDYDERHGYQIQDGSGRYHLSRNLTENEYHLWSIADAKDGDILSAKIDGDDYILIFKQIKDGWIETYGHYYITIDKFCAPTQMFCRNYQGRLYPATQEQYKTLFKKMRDDGYEWDFDKNELKKIHPHYDIANFKPFDKVLVRDNDKYIWSVELFSFYRNKHNYPFRCVGNAYSQCIPFNDETKHLLGTTDTPSEEYINW